MKIKDMFEENVDAENYSIGQLNIYDGVLTADINYPRINTGPHNIREVEVGLMDVRAADSIRISYDFDRDGYVIKQASVFEGVDEDFDSDWQEVAFVKAWGREAPAPDAARTDSPR